MLVYEIACRGEDPLSKASGKICFAVGGISGAVGIFYMVTRFMTLAPSVGW